MTPAKLKTLDPHTVTICKNRVLQVLEANDCLDDKIRVAVCNQLNYLSARIIEARDGLAPGTIKENVAAKGGLKYEITVVTE